MEVMKRNYDAASIVATGSFIKGLLLGSTLFEDLIKKIPYDTEEARMRAKKVFRVLESKEKMNKKVTTISVERATRAQNKRSYP